MIIAKTFTMIKISSDENLLNIKNEEKECNEQQDADNTETSDYDIDFWL